ncbi:LGFP repeat-containing protein [Agromyces sp. LHK192]|uniref:LGFP repeat-containing protein n=1 Tax=Agromyces sp. LHK192 TaxID=2498704 RepID=UPI000FD6CF3F|nr:hypothetical protein [Agromyces sp. LHK192]
MTPATLRDRSFVAAAPVRAVTWDDYRRAIRFGGAGSVTAALPAITAKHAEHPVIGEPAGPVAELSDGAGYVREFERGTIAWTSERGAACVHGMVRDIWVLLGGRSGRLGLPTTDVAYDEASGLHAAEFAGGRISWSAPAGPTIDLA